MGTIANKLEYTWKWKKLLLDAIHLIGSNDGYLYNTTTLEQLAKYISNNMTLRTTTNYTSLGFLTDSIGDAEQAVLTVNYSNGTYTLDGSDVGGSTPYDISISSDGIISAYVLLKAGNLEVNGNNIIAATLPTVTINSSSGTYNQTISVTYNKSVTMDIYQMAFKINIPISSIFSAANSGDTLLNLSVSHPLSNSISILIQKR